jgi:uncharacterized protein
MPNQEIEPFSFALSKQHLVGDLPVTTMPRLKDECVDDSGTIHWELEGGSHKSGHPQIEVRASGTVRLICQRCMKVFDFQIGSSSILVIAKNEQGADEIDATLQDEDVDVIVGALVLDVVQLIEDEALLAIPQAPKHVECSPQQHPVIFDDTPVALSPFAVLKKNKH